MMGQKRPDADHLRLQFLQENQILCQTFKCLTGGTHHKTGTHLIPQLFEGIKACLAVGKRHLLRMQFAVMGLIGGLMTEQISVCTGFL